VGLALGYLSAGLFVRSDDPLSSLTDTGSSIRAFQIGHYLGVSGVVAVVVAGLIVGNTGLSGSVSASTRLTFQLLGIWFWR